MATAAPSFERRLRSVRRAREGGLAGGVCAGIARAFGVDVVFVRIAAVATTTVGGIGLIAYLLAWVFIPAGDGAGTAPLRIEANWREVAGVALLALAVLLTLRALGVWWSDGVVGPVVLASAGVAVIWRQARAPEIPVTRTPARGSDWRAALPPLPSSGPRLFLGAFLVVAGAIFALQETSAVSTLGSLAVATGVMLGGVTLIFGTSWLGLLRALTAERSARIRVQERAEMAAHLHDSVLQTLALIQRTDDPEAATLARRQERELRAWLNGRPVGPAAEATTLVQALEVVAADVERDHRTEVDVVGVGDVPLDDKLRALVEAAREAAVNAAKFAGTGHVDIFAEVTPERAEVFVRDRGSGFDVAAVPAPRRGVRESIVGRMERHGGTAVVTSAPGAGTEVELIVDRTGGTGP